MHKKVVQDERELEQFAHQLAAKLKPRTVIALVGELGTGKTTLVRYLARILGATDKVKSPSYVIMNHYKSSAYQIYHLDFYRLAGENPWTAVDLQALLSDPNGLVLIEWAELISDYLPEGRLEIHFKHLGGEKRELQFNFDL